MDLDSRTLSSSPGRSAGEAAEEDRDAVVCMLCVEVIAAIGRPAKGALVGGSGGYGETYSLKMLSADWPVLLMKAQ